MRRPVVAGLAGALTLGSVLLVSNCAVNPVTGRNELALISESQEIAMGKQGAADVTAAFGLYPDPRLQQYVNGIGQRLAERSARPQLTWEYVVIEDASVNAFALPGGYIFITRGLLSQLNSEAELASVLGHESGHVAARHNVRQMSQQELAAFGLGLGAALSPFLAKYGEIAAAGVGLLMLRNSRQDESQADQLGFWYAIAEGYDTREMIDVFGMLQRDAELGGRGRLPEWQATHPDPEHRIRDIERLVETSSHDFEALEVTRDPFLRRLDGMPFGVDPRDGYFAEGRFIHPRLAFQMRFPTDWKTENAAQAVTAVSPDDDAIVQLRAVPGSAQEAARNFAAQDGVRSSPLALSTAHRNPTVTTEFTASTDQESLQGLATFIEYGGRTWGIIAYSNSTRFRAYAPAFRQTLTSLEQLTDPIALAAQPLRIQLTEVPGAMTLKQFHSRYPSAIPLAELAIVNGMRATGRLRAGQLVKRVVASAPIP